MQLVENFASPYGPLPMGRGCVHVYKTDTTTTTTTMMIMMKGLTFFCLLSELPLQKRQTCFCRNLKTFYVCESEAVESSRTPM